MAVDYDRLRHDEIIIQRTHLTLGDKTTKYKTKKQKKKKKTTKKTADD